MNMSNQAIKTAQELVKMLISCYSVEIELKDRAEYEVENIHQLELIDAIFSASDSDDETKSWILIPSMKIAVATLKMNGPEDEYEPLFEIAVIIRNRKLVKFVHIATDAGMMFIWQ